MDPRNNTMLNNAQNPSSCSKEPNTDTVQYIICHPKKISVEMLLSWKDKVVVPIEGINIPNIIMPSHLLSKKRSTEVTETISINIRQLFNSCTEENITKAKEQLRQIVYSKAHNVEMLEEIANEILQNFIVNEKNIKIYIQLLNAIWNASVLIPATSTEKTASRTIGNYFLQKCKNLIFSYISETHIHTLAIMDLDDEDKLDIFNREREKIINTIITVCQLYGQRNTNLIKLNAIHIYSVIKDIFKTYNKLQLEMKNLGNPYVEDCADEEKYETLRKMCTLYAEQLYTFIFYCGEEFNKDEMAIKDKDISEAQFLSNYVTKFKKEIVPTITEAYLISKCESLNV